MTLVYDDIVLHPSEVRNQYPIEIDSVAQRAPLLYLTKLAPQSLGSQYLPKLQELKRRADASTGEEKQTATAALLDYILRSDPWTAGALESLTDTTKPDRTAEETLAFIAVIEQRAADKSVELEPEERAAMDRNLAFWRARIAASGIMAESVAMLADRPDARAVALVCGKAHTDSISKWLRKSRRPFAVITPLSLQGTGARGDVTWEAYQRKYRKLPIYSQGFTDVLLQSLGSSRQKKAPPVLGEPWFQGKAELYLFTERVVGGLLGPPPPTGGTRLPFGFDDDEFRGKWVFVDPRTIRNDTDTQGGEGQAVLFPAVLNWNDPLRRVVPTRSAGSSVPPAFRALIAGTSPE